MPPAINSLSTIRASTTDLPTDAGLSWPSLLSFAAILLAGMQGTLAMESADPCRISFRKLRLLLSFEVAEVGVITASEVFSFIELRKALRVRLGWLSWAPACLLAVGLLELSLDMVFTVKMSIESRIDWIPFSSVNRKTDGTKRRSLEGLPLTVTAALSLVLIGWRQRWWWVLVETSSAEDAIAATRAEKSLSVGAMAFCVGWALFLNSYLVVTFWITVLLEREDFFAIADIKRMFKPHDHAIAPRGLKDNDERRRAQCKRLLELRAECLGTPLPDDFDAAVERYLAEAPLHIGNAIVGGDQKAIFENDDGGAWYIHVLLLISEHVSILPLLITMVVAVSRLWDSLDTETFEALKELVDAVVIVAILEIAIGLKNVLWGQAGNDMMTSTADIPRCERVEKV